MIRRSRNLRFFWREISDVWKLVGGGVAMVLAASVLAAAGNAAQDKLPHGFVYLRDVAPQVLQDIRYAGHDNFVGRALPGYDAPECVLREDAAKALARAQEELAKAGFGLKVYDCYRPARAVNAMMSWVTSGPSRTYYHPAIPRTRLRELGYIAGRSGHSQGTVVDLTLVASPAVAMERLPPPVGGACSGPPEARERDGSIDMGTSFDCFDVKSHFDARGLSAAQRAARARLRTAMVQHGFRAYSREWWHFTLAGGSASEILDFPIRPR